MGRAEMFPGKNGEPDTLRFPLDAETRDAIEATIIDEGLPAAIDIHGGKVVEAAFTNPDFAELVDPAPDTQIRGFDDAA